MIQIITWQTIVSNIERCRELLINTTAIAASLIPKFGFEEVQKLVKRSFDENIPFVRLILAKRIIEEEEIYKILSEELGIKIE